MYTRRSPYASEAVLIEHLIKRDEQAFRWLYHHYSGALQMHLRRLVRDPEQARDLMQEVFIKIWQNMARYNAGKGRLYTWMRNIAERTAIDVLRASTAKHRPSASRLIALDPETTYLIDQVRWVAGLNPDHVGLREHVAQLSPNYRRVVELVYLEHYTQQEAAEVLALPVGTVKTRLRAAIRVLGAAFQ